MTATLETTAYGIRRTVNLSYQDALQKVTAALKEQGFGVLTEIDIREKLKEKLGADFRQYMILGACNPPLAHRALQADIDIGLLLPCNVIVYDAGEGRSVIAAADPEAMMLIAQNPSLAAVAQESKKKLETAIASV